MTTGAGEQPDDLLDDGAPAGTPVADQVAEQAADLWCVHGVRWTATGDGWVADDAADSPHLGHEQSADAPSQVAGALPETCQPTYGSEQAWRVNAPARVAQQVIEDEQP